MLPFAIPILAVGHQFPIPDCMPFHAFCHFGVPPMPGTFVHPYHQPNSTLSDKRTHETFSWRTTLPENHVLLRPRGPCRPWTSLALYPSRAVFRPAQIRPRHLPTLGKHRGGHRGVCRHFCRIPGMLGEALSCSSARGPMFHSRRSSLGMSASL
jgi:hypothetical protein